MMNKKKTNELQIQSSTEKKTKHTSTLKTTTTTDRDQKSYDIITTSILWLS